MSTLDDLNDHCFSLATELLVDLCDAFEEETGHKPTLAEVCELLAWGFRGCSADLLKDINPFQVVALKAKVSGKGKIRSMPGDVVAIPAGRGEHYLAVYLGRFRGPFGHAFGVILGRHRLRPPTPDWEPAVYRRPVCTEIQPISSGRWKVLAHRPDFLARFPPYPEHFHRKSDFPDDPRIGPFGSAEAPTEYEGERGREGVVDYSTGTETCVLRHLSREEAEAIGLEAGDFFQNGLEEEFLAFLHRLNDTEAGG
jgi:hypothetical protein